MRRRRLRQDDLDEPVRVKAGPSVCPLCDRVIPPGARSSRHHLTPKLKGGAKGATVLLHHICHQAIHARFTEGELARSLNGVDALRDHPDLADFLAWVRTKPGEFHARTATTTRRREERREARSRK